MSDAEKAPGETCSLERAKKIIDEATKLPMGERSGYLLEACGDDAELLDEVRSLLAFEDVTPAWAEAPLLPEPLRPFPETALRPDERVGPYRVERLLGEGGMGLVALARRERDFEKRVALKLVHGPITSASVRRFERERQILASLEHPGIARLLDGGTRDGRPWLAMEYVDGVPIDRFCADRALDVGARLRLVLRVGDALASAHRLGIVHRDLKPSNVLVTRDGTPKLLDFGIAKHLEDETTDPTGPSERPMTLRWAAPEQVEGGTITPATDVHGLGLLLYRLLADVHPFAEEPSGPALEAAVRTRVPMRPSATVADAARRRRLSGDLDAIVMKALSKDPEERYVSIESLLEDLRAHLDGRPVTARRFALPSARRVASRYRLALVAMILFWIGGATGFFLERLLEEKHSLELRLAERDQADRGKEMLTDLLWNAHPSASGEDLLQMLEEKVAAEVDPTVQAQLLLTIGRIYAKWGQLERALNVWERALKILKVRFPKSEFPEGHSELAIAFNNLASGHFMNVTMRRPGLFMKRLWR